MSKLVGKVCSGYRGVEGYWSIDRRTFWRRRGRRLWLITAAVRPGRMPCGREDYC